MLLKCGMSSSIAQIHRLRTISEMDKKQFKQCWKYERTKQIKFKLLFFKLNYVVQTLGKQGKPQVK